MRRKDGRGGRSDVEEGAMHPGIDGPLRRPFSHNQHIFHYYALIAVPSLMIYIKMIFLLRFVRFFQDSDPILPHYGRILPFASISP